MVGALLGLVGGGGSILAVPALLYGVGMPLSEAVPTSLVVVGVSSAVAIIPRLPERHVQWRLAGIFGLTGAAAAFGGAAVNRALEPWLVLSGFALLVVAAGLRMLTEQPETGGDCALPSGGINWRGCLPKSVLSGALVGFLTGLFGVGGGFVIVPALVLLLGLPMVTAVATSLVVIVVNSVAGFAAHAGSVDLDYAVTGAFTGGAVVAALLAGRLVHRVPADLLRKGFAVLLLVVAVFVIVQVIVDPAAVA